MRLVSFDGGRRVGVIVDDRVVDVTSVLGAVDHETSAMRRLIARWPAVADDVRTATGPSASLAATDLDPVVPDPSKIVAAPVNYTDHMVEMSQTTHIGSLGVFLKAPSSLLGHGGQVRLPYTDRRFDQEGELALVIGRRAVAVSEQEALSHVFGYTGCLDITMRGGEDRSTRKSFDTFTPLGPWLVTADEMGDPGSLGLECSVNGVVRQRASTRDLIWSVPAIVSYVSSVMTLLPGDVISTGTPAGVGEIHDGDQVDLVIDGLGPLRVSVTAAGAGPCPTSGARSGPVPPATVTPLRPSGDQHPDTATTR